MPVTMGAAIVTVTVTVAMNMQLRVMSVAVGGCQVNASRRTRVSSDHPAGTSGGESELQVEKYDQ